MLCATVGSPSSMPASNAAAVAIVQAWADKRTSSCSALRIKCAAAGARHERMRNVCRAFKHSAALNSRMLDALHGSLEKAHQGVHL